ncbi:2',3'-cyclic-nucleotide 2'-phosphodiesterase/5'-or 3'-nucleotidase, 5'-nucleotidase family [Alkalibacterium subtropicum]|uniref:2',3'-cyclic-nucleotide 2'-phosphodiesterase/5'-or 3'-nucleotidase, 5'-nucleotidase family n=1 Tax=Alkalibacterium subtropicum TaxID=753702 RepID=A0A1I1L437_9LACT|nr:5'-nucleotidase C-terminal domain-containing protein [Alkalibacterium subtropicum]SFC64360.1 2',3'-cyclic-nucleotide 2'-phosphodiesterase/5'-or 3'-nucleotidase, 5'-nucleotidase family [Alkalibacterium subtropicum]
MLNKKTLAVSFLSLSLALGLPEDVKAAEVEEDFSLTVFHTNDMHASIDEFGKISYFLNEQRALADNSLYLDAGDIFSGNPVVDLMDGIPMIELLNKMELDLITIGNHEFDYGQEVFQDRRNESDFNWISANTSVTDPSIPITDPDPYEIFEFGDKKVGVFALTQAPPATSPTGIVGLEFGDYMDTIETFESLRDEVDVLVALNHIGISADRQIAEAYDMFDVIIGGHSHTTLTEPEIVNGTPIASSGSNARNIGVLNLTLDAETGDVSVEGHLQPVEALSDDNVDPEVQTMIDAYNAESDELLGEVLGQTETGLSRDDRWEKDVALGNMITDALRNFANTDIAITNNGGIRAGIEPGDITARDVFTVDPFGNAVTIVEMTGHELKDIVAYSYHRSLDSYGPQIDLQTSGLNYTIYTDENGLYADSDLYVDGSPIDLDKTYSIATNNFIVAGGDGYDFSEATVIQSDAGQVTNALIQHISETTEKEGAVNYEPTEGRIQTKPLAMVEDFSVTLFHTNDMHASIDDFGKISYFLNEYRDTVDHSLYLDAGDIFSGNPVVDLLDGIPMIELLNKMELDLMTIGNHEFDYGQQVFQDRRNESDFNWISANTEVVDPSIPITQPDPYQIFEMGDKKIGVIGLTQAPPATSPTGIVGLGFENYMETIEEYKSLRDDVDILVALNHVGIAADRQIAEVYDHFDVIIGGHSHTTLTEPEIVNGTPIASSGSSAENIGILNLTLDSETGEVSVEGSLQAVDELPDENVNPEVQSIIDQYNAESEELLGEVLGQTETGLSRDDRWLKDVALGNMITDALRNFANTDIAITNNGGIRAGIEPGDITARDIFTVDPFGNAVTILEMTGQELQEIIAYSYHRSLDSYGPQIDLQTSGLNYIIYTDEEGLYADADLFVDGEPIDMDATYSIATNNFIVSGGDGYDFSDAAIIQSDAGQVTNALIQYIEEVTEKEGAVNYDPTEGRIQTMPFEVEEPAGPTDPEEEPEDPSEPTDPEEEPEDPSESKDPEEDKEPAEEESEAGEKLPETATMTWAAGLMGLVSLSLGGAARFIQNKR